MSFSEDVKRFIEESARKPGFAEAAESLSQEMIDQIVKASHPKNLRQRIHEMDEDLPVWPDQLGTDWSKTLLDEARRKVEFLEAEVFPALTASLAQVIDKIDARGRADQRYCTLSKVAALLLEQRPEESWGEDEILGWLDDNI